MVYAKRSDKVIVILSVGDVRNRESQHLHKRRANINATVTNSERFSDVPYKDARYQCQHN